MKPEFIDTNEETKIMTVEEVAHYLQKSISWVYKNWKILGGRKLGGSLFFPNKEDLYEYIFYQEEGMEVRFYPKRDSVYRVGFHNQDRRSWKPSAKKPESNISGITR